MKRLILATALLLASVQTGQASLECDGYFGAGYFGTTYYLDGYWPENACGGGSSPETGKNGLSIDGVTIGM